METKEGGPVLTNLFQPEVIGEIVKGCVQKYPTSVDVLTEYEFVITKPSEMIASIVAKYLQSMKQWGGMCSNIQYTLVSKSKLRSIRSVGKNENSPQVSTNVPVELLVEKMMSSIMNQVDELSVRTVCQGYQTRSFATDEVIGNHGGVPMVDSQNSLGGGVAHLVHHTPRISFFRGEDPPNKTEKTYEQWIFDVKTIRPSYPEGLLKEAIFGSLKGNAADIARGLGPETTVDQVLELLNSIFGRKTNPDVLMQDFYRIVQEPTEKVSNFGIRFKVALDRIMGFHPESLTKDEAAKKLKDGFYYGVRQNIREGLRYYYEVLQADYTALLTKARSIKAEKSNIASGTSAIAKSAASVMSDTDSGIENFSKTMSEFITIVKGQQEKGSTRQNRNNNNNRNGGNDRKGANGNKDGRNQRGPDPNASGPFRNGAPLIQCYKCWGWGHKSLVGPSHLNYQVGWVPKQEPIIPSPPNPHVNRGQSSPNPETTPKQNQQ